MKKIVRIFLIVFLLYICISYNWRTVQRLGNKLDPDNAQFIFVGGHDSSGTGLMRILLDVHPKIRCGAEPAITLKLLGNRHSVDGSLRAILIESGVYPEAYDQAVASFIQKVIEKMGPPADYLCHKEPMTFLFLRYLAFLFPKAKFIHMLRDGRAAVMSSLGRGIEHVSGEDAPAKGMRRWERIVSKMLIDCQDIGPERCITVRYEPLVLSPELTTKKLFQFLEIPWDPVLLEHHKMLDNATHLNKYEPSTRQFVRAIHTESLSKWADPDSGLPEMFRNPAQDNQTLLKKLGYVDCGYPPDYRRLSSDVPRIQLADVI